MKVKVFSIWHLVFGIIIIYLLALRSFGEKFEGPIHPPPPPNFKLEDYNYKISEQGKLSEGALNLPQKSTVKLKPNLLMESGKVIDQNDLSQKSFSLPIMPISPLPKTKAIEKLLTLSQIVFLLILVIIFFRSLKHWYGFKKRKKYDLLLGEASKKIAADLYYTRQLALDSINESSFFLGENYYNINEGISVNLPESVFILSITGTNPLKFNSEGIPQGSLVIELGNYEQSLSIMVNPLNNEIKIIKHYDLALREILKEAKVN
ncbi:MAG: hypothetical protein HYU63_06240 [Armatimonadetes bacterium]|nr:hypothetical protein [Armatimonadota bacterium]